MVCSKLKSLIIDTTITDNLVFRLHYKASVIILLATSVLVACIQYFGGAINCVSRDDIPTSLLNDFCWIHATYSISQAWAKKVGQEVPYPGIDKYRRDNEHIYHSYYRWISFVLFLQAIFFYIPKFLWRAMEGGKIRNLTSGMNFPFPNEELECVRRKRIVEYMVSNSNNRSLYFTSCVISEIMNFANVVGQIFLTNAFLGGNFLTYGTEVIQFTGWSSADSNPMLKIFPRLTICNFYRYGSSGDVQRHDSMCMLTANVVNEKIYLFLWFWFVILSVLSALVLIYRAVIVCWTKFRFMIIRFRYRMVQEDYLKSIIYHCTLSDWLILDLLSKNLDPLTFRDVINDFGQKITADNHELMAD